MEDKKSNNIDPLFWLPSDFLTDDDDILMAQHNLSPPYNKQLPTHFPYDFTELTRHFTSQNKWGLLGSPQSIPSPVLSNGSPNAPSSLTAPFGKRDEQSWNIACAAAGEVNMGKMSNQTSYKSRALPSPHYYFTPLPPSSKNITTHMEQNNVSVRGHPFGVSGEYGCGFSGNVRCGRVQRPFQSKWPCCSQVQKQHFNVNGSVTVSDPSLVFSGGLRSVTLTGGSVGLKRKCAGTGVFLPRTCPNPTASKVKPGCPGSIIPPRAAQALNVKNHNDVMTQAKAQPPFIGGVISDHADAMIMHRNAVLAQQWRNGMNMMGNRAMNCKMLLPEEWSY